MTRTKPWALLTCLSLLVACTHPDDSNVSHSLIADGAELTRIASGFTFTEGPAADKDGNVYFTDQPNNRIHKWSVDGTVSVFMENSGRANGLYVDGSGRLLACADAENQLWRIAADKAVEVLATGIDGASFNGPNDLWVSAGGGIYFTDPYYQRDWWTRTGPELESENVYYLSPEGELTIVDDDLVKPNGIVGTTDGNTLYVADIGAGATYVYRIGKRGALEDKKQFVAMGSDGMTLDTEGNVYLTGDGVSVFDRAGEPIQHIAVDAPWTSNVTFGGKYRDVLFITATDSVYTLRMNVKGARQ